MRAPSWLGTVFESPYTAVVIMLVLSALAPTGHFSATGAGLQLFAAWCVAFYGLRTQPLRIWLGGSAFLFGFLCTDRLRLVNLSLRVQAAAYPGSGIDAILTGASSDGHNRWYLGIRPLA